MRLRAHGLRTAFAQRFIGAWFATCRRSEWCPLGLGLSASYLRPQGLCYRRGEEECHQRHDTIRTMFSVRLLMLYVALSIPRYCQHAPVAGWRDRLLTNVSEAGRVSPHRIERAMEPRHPFAREAQSLNSRRRSRVAG